MPVHRTLEKHFAASETVRDVEWDVGRVDGAFALPRTFRGDRGSRYSTSWSCRVGGDCRRIDRHGPGWYLAGPNGPGPLPIRARSRNRRPRGAERESTRWRRLPRLRHAEQDMVPAVQAVCADQKRWVDFMMRSSSPRRTRSSRARIARATISGFYILGGLVAGWPRNMLVRQLYTALSVRCW